MNFLAHAFLAGPGSADRVGGIAGDFVKGPLPGGLPADLAAGVALHRRIDSFAERHPAFRDSRARVSAPRRRVAGIMVDLFYDHFLARHWAEWSSETLGGFAQGVYAQAAARVAELPPAAAPVLARMASEDWLVAYRDPAAIGRALDRMAQFRFSRANPLGGGGDELLAGYAGFEADFMRFLPDALEFAQAWRRDACV